MNKINVELFAAAIAVVLSFPLHMYAQDASGLYQSKCVACHGADGSGSPTGTKLGAHDFHSPEVQKQSDAELTATLTNGKNKMPAYGKSLKANDIKGLVAYVRSLAPAK
jgi:mono/diheme cytochrome c family protein